MARILAGLALIIAVSLVANDIKTPDDEAVQKERLAALQSLVGTWRGVAQPQRGSTKDSWIEEADWIWSFGPEGPALVAKLPKSKYFKQLKLLPGKEASGFVLVAKPIAGGDDARYAGNFAGQEQLVLVAEQPQDDLPQRLSFRFVAGGDRLLILMEKKNAAGDQFIRLAEVGYTRQGSGFGKTSSQRECVVTGGLGTIEVMHAGKTYYVCCTGCRDYFNENAEKVLAEYVARKEAEKAKK
jgi:hypothetical protein